MRGLVRILAFSVAGVLSLLLAGCQTSGDPDPVSFDDSGTTPAAQSGDSSGSETTEPEDEDSTTTSSSTTTEAPALTEEQQLFDEQVAEAERQLKVIVDYNEARQACSFDHENCDFGFADYLTDGAGEKVISAVKDRIAEGVFYERARSETYFVQSVPSSVQSAEVWVCSSSDLAKFRRDENGEQIDFEQLDRPDEFQVYELIDQGDEEWLINQIESFDKEGDPKPEGGSCDAYKEWPPPSP